MSAPYQSQPYGISSAFGATFGARRKYLSMSLGFAVPARSRRKSSAARREPTFSATAAAMDWLNDTPSVAANSAAASSPMWKVSMDRHSCSFLHPLEHDARCNHFYLVVACCRQKVTNIVYDNGRSSTFTAASSTISSGGSASCGRHIK
jgi:hypothetical protein